MSNTNASLIIESVMAKQIIETSETSALRRWFYGEGLLSEADAEALFHVNAALRAANPDFDRLFVETLTDFIVYRQRPTGRITPGKAEWLIGMLGGPGNLLDTHAELELLVCVLEEAHEVPANLAAFALAQVKHAAITGEGPAARGRVHFSRTVDAADVGLIDRMLHKGGNGNGIAVSRAEAEILFEIAEACTGNNDEAWDALFVEAIAGHVVQTGRPGPSQYFRDLTPDPGTVEWLDARIHSDGQVSPAEQTLLNFINRPQAIQDVAARAAIVRMA